MSLARRLQNLDRRWLYLITALVIGLPFVPGVKVPVPPPAVSPQTTAYYDTIERLARDPVESKKLVIIATNYGAGTLAENQSQCEATIKHLMRHKMKFALFSFSDAQSRELGQRLVERIGPPGGYEYGRDWVNFGYRPWDGIDQIIKSMSTDLPGTIGAEIKGAPVGTLPVMAGIKTGDDVALIINLSSVASLDKWFLFSRPNREQQTMLYGPTSVMAPEAFPLLKSGQLSGMLVGLKGAIEYEVLLNEPGFATQASASLSWAHFFILGLIFLGNVGMFLEKRGRR